LSASSNNATTVQANTTVIGSLTPIMGTTLSAVQLARLVTGITSSAANNKREHKYGNFHG
jgi:hypothetical protein